MNNLKNQNGSAGMGLVAGIMSLALAGFYVLNSSRQASNSIKAFKKESLSADLSTNNISNLALLRGMLNPSKIGSGATALYEPALYPAHYFQINQWSLQKNDEIKNQETKLDGNTISVKTFETVTDPKSDIVKEIEKTLKQSAKQKMSDFKDLRIIRPNPHPDHPNWVQSVDVEAKNTVVASNGTKSVVTSIGRVFLLPPEPGKARLEIREESSSEWLKEFGTAASPLPYGKYFFRVIAGGVTVKATVKRDGGDDIVLGLKDGRPDHAADNIKAKDVVLGTTPDPIELGSNTVTTTTSSNQEAVQLATSITTTTATGGSDFTILKNGCQAYTSPGTGAGVPVSTTTTTPGATSLPSASTSTSESTSVSIGQIKISLIITGVDDLPADDPTGDLTKTFYVTNKVTTKNTVTTTYVASSTPAPTGPAPAPAPAAGYDGNNCSSYCPMDQNTATAPGYLWTMLSDASLHNPDKKKTDFRAIDESGAIQALGAKGVVCYNYEAMADYMKAQLGLSNVADLQNGQGSWTRFDQLWGGGEAKVYEKWVAYVAPSCARQEVVGDRGSCGCFEETTRIRMADGSERAASTIRAGDLVWNPKTNKPQLVRRVIAGPEKLPLYAITLAGNTVKVTSEHPFLTESGLIAAKDLKLGDLVIDNGSANRVESFTLIHKEEGSPDPEVWNFELEGSENEDDHYVLANGVMTGDLFLQIKLKQATEAAE